MGKKNSHGKHSVTINKSLDNAITSQLRLQSARRNWFNFKVKFPDRASDGECPECSMLLQELTMARSANDLAIAELNRVFSDDAKNAEEGCTVR
jgi:hypothetical protein